MKIIVILLVLLLRSNGENVKMITKLVEDLIKNENVPSALSVISCWSQSDNFRFLRDSKVYTQLSREYKIPHRKDDEFVNKLWFFIDMRCNGSHNFLNEIEDAYFAHPYRWILFEPIEPNLTKLQFLADSNVILIKFNSELSRFDLNQSKNKIKQ